ncbi:hypothetical protein TKWG_09480 [Advenella kashmirensis WT001]|uniref:Uncharacterized protein n=1 Tax=Advenella kashmirensis (strain DSM 17095 / LMG 22695 / WT001) TaxID=1036672 RepID=I3UB28_ADVKW|nr:hypothetical protein TKWG_09480 [Advenella kashmirensis WT001]
MPFWRFSPFAIRHSPVQPLQLASCGVTAQRRTVEPAQRTLRRIGQPSQCPLATSVQTDLRQCARRCMRKHPDQLKSCKSAANLDQNDTSTHTGAWMAGNPCERGSEPGQLNIQHLPPDLHTGIHTGYSQHHSNAVRA